MDAKIYHRLAVGLGLVQMTKLVDSDQTTHNGHLFQLYKKSHGIHSKSKGIYWCDYVMADGCYNPFHPLLQEKLL